MVMAGRNYRTPLDEDLLSLTRGKALGAPSPTWRVLAALSAAVAVAVHILIARRATSPAMPFDEITFLQMSRWIGGEDAPERLRGAGYFPGWSILLRPIWWVTQDPGTAYTLAITLSVIVSLATAWPLWCWVKRTGISSAQSVVVACATITIPAVAVQSAFVLAENAIQLALAVLAVAVWRLWERPTYWRAIAVGLMASVVYLMHLRALAVVVVTAIWLLLFALRSWRQSLAGLAALAAAWYVCDVGATAIAEGALGHELGQEDSLVDSFSNLTLGWVSRIAAGQAWTQVVGTLGIVSIALVAVAITVIRSVRSARPTPMIWFFGLGLAFFAITVVKWSSPEHLVDPSWVRLDVWLYGRYADPVGVLAFALGMALAVAGLRRAVAWAGVAVAAAICTAALALTAPFAATWGYVSPPHLAGVLAWDAFLPEAPPVDPSAFGGEATFWWLASGAALVLPLAIALLPRARAAVSTLTLLGVAAISLAAIPAIDRFHAIEGTVPESVHDLSEWIDRGVSIDYVTDCARDGHDSAVGENYLMWWLSAGDITTVPSLRDADADIIIWCSREGDLPRDGAIDITGADEIYGSTIWVTDPALLAGERPDGGTR